MKNLEELVSQFKPYRAPPAPQPFPAELEQKATDKQAKTERRGRKPKQKIFVTEIRVTESTHADGRKTYAASSSPIVRLPDAPHETTIEAPAPFRHQRQPFLNRMRQRQQASLQRQHQRQLDQLGERQPVSQRAPSSHGQARIKMFLISVKRQRKLKMKKHKYKKLMKRTRNLRRRLGRT